MIEEELSYETQGVDIPDEDHSGDSTKSATTIDPEKIAKDLASRIIKGKTILDACEAQLVSSLQIDGRTLPEWREYLYVEIPDDVDDLASLEKTVLNLAKSVQECESVLARFEAAATAVTDFHEDGFARSYVEELSSSGSAKKLAAEKIRQIVIANNPHVNATLAASQTAALVVEYFKRLSRGLDSARKNIENRIEILRLRTRNLGWSEYTSSQQNKQS